MDQQTILKYLMIAVPVLNLIIQFLMGLEGLVSASQAAYIVSIVTALSGVVLLLQKILPILQSLSAQLTALAKKE